MSNMRGDAAEAMSARHRLGLGQYATDLDIYSAARVRKRSTLVRKAVPVYPDAHVGLLLRLPDGRTATGMARLLSIPYSHGRTLFLALHEAPEDFSRLTLSDYRTGLKLCALDFSASQKARARIPDAMECAEDALRFYLAGHGVEDMESMLEDLPTLNSMPPSKIVSDPE